MFYFLTFLGVYFFGVFLLYLIYMWLTEESPSNWQYSRNSLNYDLGRIFFVDTIGYDININYMFIELYIWSWPIFFLKWIFLFPILSAIFIIFGVVKLFSSFFDKFYDFVKGEENNE